MNTSVTEDKAGIVENLHPLSVPAMRQVTYPGSEISIEQTLQPGSNYNRYVTSYISDGLKIYALLTIPQGEKPATGWPVIIFNHGYIPPEEYRTTERYLDYTDAFSRNGYILFRSDYRGHGGSEGEARGGFGNNDYTIDVLNAVSSIKKHPDVDPNRIGMWGHSMGGYITLRNMVATKDVKAGVIWAGVVASYPEMINNWPRRNPNAVPSPSRTRWRDTLQKTYGKAIEANPFWKSISSTSYLSDISGPLQMHHGTADDWVPVAFSQNLEKRMKEVGKEVDYYEYPDDDHNISENFSLAMQRSVDFFDTHLK